MKTIDYLFKFYMALLAGGALLLGGCATTNHNDPVTHGKVGTEACKALTIGLTITS